MPKNRRFLRRTAALILAVLLLAAAMPSALAADTRTGTVSAPMDMIAISSAVHSQRVRETMATESPLLTPSPTRPLVPSAIIALVFDHGTFGIALGAVIEQIEQVDVAVNRLLDGIGELLDDTSIVYGLISDVFSHTPHVTPRMLQNTRETTDCPDQMAPAIRYFGQTR